MHWPRPLLRRHSTDDYYYPPVPPRSQLSAYLHSFPTSLTVSDLASSSEEVIVLQLGVMVPAVTVKAGGGLRLRRLKPTARVSLLRHLTTGQEAWVGWRS